MSKGMMITGVIVLSLLTFGLVNIIQNYQTGNELDYSLLKDSTEAAMIDAIDLSYYQITGQVRIDKEKFVESFVRRFAQSVNGERNYRIQIYDINETPPKVSVRIGSSTSVSFAGDDFNIANRIDAILETSYEDDRTVEEVTDAQQGTSQ